MFTISAICRLSIEPLFRYIIINIRVHPFKKLNRYLLNTFNSKGYPHQITRDPNKNIISFFTNDATVHDEIFPNYVSDQHDAQTSCYKKC